MKTQPLDAVHIGIKGQRWPEKVYEALIEATGAIKETGVRLWFQKGPCPRDTNGDGDCGQRLCPHCGVNGTGGRWLVEALRFDPHHITEYTESGWSIQHPIECRDNLQECFVHKAVASQNAGLDSAPVPLGRYITTLDDSGYPLYELFSGKAEYAGGAF